MRRHSFPSFGAVAAVPPTTIVLLFEASLRLTAKGIMVIFRIRESLTSSWIRVGSTILLPTGPTPRSTASASYMEFPIQIKAARKHIVARCVFETPPLAPGALFRICRTGLGHFFGGRKDFLVNSRRRWSLYSH